MFRENHFKKGMGGMINNYKKLDDEGVMNELIKIVQEIDSRYISCNCVRPEYLDSTWIELCNKGIEILEFLRDGE